MAEEKRARRSRSQPKPRAASIGAAATDDGPEAAQPKAPDEVTMVETMLFKFTVDRFGFRTPEGEIEDEIKYAREALRALNHWAAAMEALFGDTDRGLRAAGEARILAYNRTWNSTFESRKRVDDNLGVDIQAHLASEKDGPRPAVELIDQKTRDAVEELRIYLRMLGIWRRTFEAGLWIATIAAQGSIEGDPRSRLLRGVGAIAAACEFDAIDSPDRISEELRFVAQRSPELTSDGPATSVVAAHLASAIEAAAAALQEPDSPMGFVVKPALLYDWVDRLRGQLTLHQHEDPLPAEQWAALEMLYWRQWNWPMAGAVVRRPDSLSKISVLDLMVAARYEGEPFLHWRGGLLTISQWSRLLAIASPERIELMREPAEAALGQLGFPELIRLLPTIAEKSPAGAAAVESRRGARAPPPLVALSIFLKDLTLWRPDPAVRAFALLPLERHEADERIAHYGISAPSVGRSLLEELIAISNEEREAAKLHLIEVPPRRDIREITDSMSQSARALKWSRVYFAAQQPPLGGSGLSLCSSARSIRELVLEVRRDFRELFPDEPMSGWRRWYTGRYRKFQQTRVYAVIRRWPAFQWLEKKISPVVLTEG